MHAYIHTCIHTHTHTYIDTNVYVSTHGCTRMVTFSKSRGEGGIPELLCDYELLSELQ